MTRNKHDKKLEVIMESFQPILKLPIWKEAALIFQGHQYVEIFKIYDYSPTKEAVDKATSEDSLVRDLESQRLCFLGCL